MAQYKNIDIVPDETITRVHLSQGDIGRTLIFYLFENALSWSVPASSTIKCQGTKPSGFGFSVSCTYSGNAVTCVTTDEMTDEYGQIEAELVITSSDESQVFGTSNFILDIEKNPHPDGTVDGDAENPVIANLNAVITQAVDDWLDEHPEATTTVTDGSITEPKLASALALKTIKDYVTPEMFGAVGDGVADDTQSVSQAFTYDRVMLVNTYKVTDDIACNAYDVFGNGAIVAVGDINVLTFSNDAKVKDITIQMASQSDSIGMTFLGNCEVNNVVVTNGRVGVLVNNNYKRCVVKRSFFSGMYGDSARAIYNQYSGMTTCVNNVIENISNNLDVDADGVFFWQAEDTRNLPYVIIKGNVFHNCRGRFIKASTQNVEISNNYCYNDNDFATITNFNAIDVQKGASVVTQNRIVAKNGINISLRLTTESNIHCVSENVIDATTSYAITVLTYANQDTKATVLIKNNTLNCADRTSLYLDYIPNGKYVLTDNNVVGRTSGVCVKFHNTFDSSCRFVAIGNKCGYLYFISFANEPNVFGDEKVACTKDVAAGSVLPHTRYIANTATLTTHGYALLEAKGNASATGFLIFLTNAYGHYIFNRSGTKIN